MITLDMIYSWEMARKRRIAAGGGSTPLTLTALTAGSKVTLTKVGSPLDVSLQYSTGGAWATYTIGTEITLASAGDYVQFRGDNSGFSTSISDYYQFAMSGTIGASGNVMSLVDSTCESLTIPCDFCFQRLFRGCTSLTTAPALPATTLALYCYYEMFYGCTSLTTAPELPATTLAPHCYNSMFYGCTSLTTAPALPATTLAPYCCSAMFQGCTSLTTAPALPATTLATECYSYMFDGCTKLSSIEVSFTSWTQASGQTYSWVRNVASSGTFTKPAALATEYGANRIPTGWTVVDKSDAGDTEKPLTFTALAPNSTIKLNKVGSPPDVSLEYSTGGAWSTYTIGTEITLASAGDYIQFRGDNSTFSTTANDYYQFVMTGTIEASGNVMSLVDSTCESLTIPCDFCFQRLFRGCTSLTTAPALPATTLAPHCYNSMFNGCTSLTTAPALPATTLAPYCYSYMFNFCTKLSSIEVSFTSWTQATEQTYFWVQNVASSGTFTKPTALATEYGPYRIPTGWTVIDK